MKIELLSNTKNKDISISNEVFSKEPDIVLLDLRMPDLSGIDVLKKIRTKNTDTCYSGRVCTPPGH